jgi:LPXTG-motif cell wall-anchored protein
VLAKVIGDQNGNGGVTGTVTGTVGSLLDKIDKTLKTTPVGSVTHTALTALQKELKALQAALPKLVATLESGSVVDVKALDSGHNIATTAGNTVSSNAHGALAHLSLLGGFVTLDGFNNSVTATANGKANGAKAIVNPNLAKVHVGSPVGLDLILGPDGLTGNLLGADLPAEITGLVNSLVGQISNILSVAGVKIAPAKYTTKYNSNNSAVSVAGSGLQVLVNNPLNRSNTDFNKAMVGVKVGALAASAGDFIQQGSNPRVIHPSTPKAPLPHTGANLPVTAGAAMVFLTGAYFVRRRFRATEV